MTSLEPNTIQTAASSIPTITMLDSTPKSKRSSRTLWDKLSSKSYPKLGIPFDTLIIISYDYRVNDILDTLYDWVHYYHPWHNYGRTTRSPDGKIMVQTRPLKPRMAPAKVTIECGDLGLTSIDVFDILRAVLGKPADDAVVSAFDAKIDDPDHDFLWYAQRIHRRQTPGKPRMCGKSTLYLGRRTGEQLKVYDKVAEAWERGGGELPWATMDVCTRIEKTVRIPPEERTSWGAFLKYGALASRPFANVLIGDTDAINHRSRTGQLVVQHGLHGALYRLRKRKQRRAADALKAAVFAEPPLDLNEQWAHLVRLWAGLALS